MKKAIVALVGFIVFLGILNFVMGYLAVEAGKDARPSSNDGHRRRLEQKSYLDNIYGNRRLDHGDGPPPVPGVMVTTDNFKQGGAVNIDRTDGVEAITRLMMIPSDAVSNIEGIILPGSNGEMKAGPFTSVVE
jgi:hypothetical protein